MASFLPYILNTKYYLKPKPVFHYSKEKKNRDVKKSFPMLMDLNYKNSVLHNPLKRVAVSCCAINDLFALNLVPPLDKLTSSAKSFSAPNPEKKIRYLLPPH